MSSHGTSQQTASQLRPPGDEVNPGHILIVDDDEVFCYATAKALRNAGFEVSLAPDHRLALQILEGPELPDLLITDLIMPAGINGFALARMGRMRRLDLRVLYVTGYDLPMEEAIGRCFANRLAQRFLWPKLGKR
jgi:CheY-like chemotaxis protein